MTPALAVERLELADGGVAALDGVSVGVPAGIVTGLTGPNGAGERFWAALRQGRAVAAHEQALAERALAVGRRLGLTHVVDNRIGGTINLVADRLAGCG